MTNGTEPTLEERANDAFNRRENIFNKLDNLKKDSRVLNFKLLESYVNWSNNNNLQENDWRANSDQIENLINTNKETLKAYSLESEFVLEGDALSEDAWDSLNAYEFGFDEDKLRENLIEQEHIDLNGFYSTILSPQERQNNLLKQNRATRSITANNLNESIEDFKLLAEQNDFEYRQEPRTLEEARRSYIRLADKIYNTNQPI